jgi:biopolymer transport protein ExbB
MACSARSTTCEPLQDGLAFLATVGSTAPFVGLFGTVWGIYHALTAIGIAGQASIDKVAAPWARR